jgi:hypothetical protein
MSIASTDRAWKIVLLSLMACGRGDPEHATLIEPVYAEPCKYTRCSDHGQCHVREDGSPQCLCDVGYAPSSCARCEAGFHLDAQSRCAPDRSCAELSLNPCGLYGSCDDTEGVVACHCDPGYEGPRCELCRPGYGRNSFGECLELVISDGSTPPPPACAGEPCHGHGECSELSGTISCACDAGYEGSRCDRCAPGHHRDAQGACVVDETCVAGQCGPHGTCQDSSGEALCFCEERYAGESCEECAIGFHPAEGGCVLDEQCQLRSCPEHATCHDESGFVMCVCDTGYAGDDCDACAHGYARDAHGACVAFMCEGNPIGVPGRLDWELRADFPGFENNCIAGLAVGNADVTLSSIGGDGTVWACAANTLYHVSSNHVFVEAGQNGPAELAFAGPIADLTFDYGARSALALEIRADGVLVRTLTAARRSSGTLSLAFSPPISLITLRSIAGDTNQLALDNVSYTPPTCQQEGP